jgi:multidrug efflux pump subunit AcrB
MSLIRVSVDNPAALLAPAVLLFVLGVMGIASLPIQMLPNLEYPEININTSWHNAARQEVGASIAEPHQPAFGQVPVVVAMSIPC